VRHCRNELTEVATLGSWNQVHQTPTELHFAKQRPRYFRKLFEARTYYAAPRVLLKLAYKRTLLLWIGQVQKAHEREGAWRQPASLVTAHRVLSAPQHLRKLRLVFSEALPYMPNRLSGGHLFCPHFFYTY
jgi:hypothetical protein